MIQLSSAGKHFGSKVLFEGLDWLLTPGERIGLVGGNGTGKSTLLKVLAGLGAHDKGMLSTSKGIPRGYLPQDGLALSGRSVLAECLSVFGNLLEMEKEMEALTHKMAELDPADEEYARVTDRYHSLETEFQQCDGYSLEAQAGAVLNGLGFSRQDQARPTEEFSGGWQMRVALAKLLSLPLKVEPLQIGKVSTVVQVCFIGLVLLLLALDSDQPTLVLACAALTAAVTLLTLGLTQFAPLSSHSWAGIRPYAARSGVSSAAHIQICPTGSTPTFAHHPSEPFGAVAVVLHWSVSLLDADTTAAAAES